MEEIDKIYIGSLIKLEVIKFTEWLWVNVGEKEMLQHNWDYWYEMWKEEIKTN